MKSQVRFVHTADWHLGRKQNNLEERYNDNFQAIKKVISQILEEHHSIPFDFILHCGDLFEKRNPSPKTLYYTIELLEKIKEKNIPFYIIRGNHDASSGEYQNNALHLLDKIGYVSVIDDQVKKIKCKDQVVHIYGIGYRVHQLTQRINEIIEENSIHSDVLTILMLHTSIKDMNDSDGRDFPISISLGNLEGHNFDYIALGHNHKISIREFQNRIIAYSGATEHWDKSNWEENGTWSLKKNWIEVICDDSNGEKSIKTILHSFEVRPKKKNRFDLKDLSVKKTIEEVHNILNKTNQEKFNSKAIVNFSFSLGFNAIEEGNPFLHIEDYINNLLVPSCQIEFKDKDFCVAEYEERTEVELIEGIINEKFPTEPKKWGKVVFGSLDLISLSEGENMEQDFYDLLIEYLVNKDA